MNRKVTIWDLDYYFASDRTNLFNTDAEQISSFHKQLGDLVNFVEKEDDVKRPYDIIYIIKENSKTPNPPLKFLLDNKVRWWGEAYKSKVKWNAVDAIWACYPDYQLYPNKNTKLERSEHIRFFNNKGELLKLTQSFENTYKNKKIVIADKQIWNIYNTEDILAVLDRIKDWKNIYFIYPINLNRLLSDGRLKEGFINLYFSPGANIQWEEISIKRATDAIDFVKRLKESDRCKSKVGALHFNYSEFNIKHWNDRAAALQDFNTLKRIIIYGKKNKVRVKIIGPTFTSETPYWQLMTLLSKWTNSKGSRSSWLEYITAQFVGYDPIKQEDYWFNIKKWNDNYRNIIRQTYKDKDFMLTKWGEDKVNEIRIPWKLWEEEFVNEI